MKIKKTGFLIGLMSGTSLDAMDGVLANMDSMPPKVLAFSSLPYPEKIRKILLQFNSSESFTLSELAEVDAAVSVLASQVVADLLQKTGKPPGDIRAIAYPGQTIAHNPRKRYTMQCGDANILAEITRIAVVTDFRRRDIATGGQGAPLASGFHKAAFSSAKEDREIVNLGGIANVTLLMSNSRTLGFDLGPANCLIDEWAQKHLDQSYDDKGQWARSGKSNDELLCSFLQDPYFSLSPPKSCGRDYFNLAWVEKHLKKGKYKPADVQASLIELTAVSTTVGICEELQPGRKVTLYLGGGGVKNEYLVERICALARCETKIIDSLGVQSEHLESLAFAWLAQRTLEGMSGNLSSVTGAAGDRVLGALYHP